MCTIVLCRPTQPTHFWPDQDHILAGRDLVRQEELCVLLHAATRQAVQRLSRVVAPFSTSCDQLQVGGGTWLAVGNNGRIAFLTNLRAHDVDPDEVGGAWAATPPDNSPVSSNPTLLPPLHHHSILGIPALWCACMSQAAAEGTHYRTRGELPAHFINSHLSPSEYLKSLEGKRWAGRPEDPVS
jgi:hypothetical protein